MASELSAKEAECVLFARTFVWQDGVCRFGVRAELLKAREAGRCLHKPPNRPSLRTLLEMRAKRCRRVSVSNYYCLWGAPLRKGVGYSDLSGTFHLLNPTSSRLAKKSRR